MRKSLLAIAAVTAVAAVPASATAADTRPDLPGTCDLVKNTICHLIPPTSVEDVCAILDSTSNLSCQISSTTRPH
jgi:hypothetical protein